MPEKRIFLPQQYHLKSSILCEFTERILTTTAIVTKVSAIIKGFKWCLNHNLEHMDYADNYMV